MFHFTTSNKQEHGFHAAARLYATFTEAPIAGLSQEVQVMRESSKSGSKNSRNHMVPIP